MTTQYASLQVSHTHLLEVMAEARRIEDQQGYVNAIKFASPSSYIRWADGAWRLFHGVSVDILMPCFGTVEVWAVMNDNGSMQRLPGVRVEDFPRAPYVVRDYSTHGVQGKTFEDFIATGAKPDQIVRGLSYAHQLAGLNALMSARGPVTDEDLLLKRNLEIPVFLLACVARYLEEASELIEETSEKQAYGIKEIEESFIHGSWGELQQVQPLAEDYAKAGKFIADLCARLKEGPEALLRFGPYGKDDDWGHLIHVAFSDFRHHRLCANA